MKSLITKINKLFKNIFNEFKNFFAFDNFKKLVKNKNIKKALVMILMSVFLLSESFAWLYDEYAGAGASLAAGRIAHSVIQYDQSGEEISDDNEVQTIVYETNMSNITVGSRYIEVINTGTLDMEFSLAFSTEGTTELAGVLYYRVYDVTEDVNNTTQGIHASKLEAYAATNQPTSAMESSTSLPVSNMSLLRNDIVIDTVSAPSNGETSSKIYRFDYGMYSAVNTSHYSDDSMSVHLNIYSSQIGVITAENRIGQVWEVQNATQFREVLNSIVAGDSIKLLNNISIDGSVNFTKAVSLDLNGFSLNITQDLIYEYINPGDISIDASGYGSLTIAEDFIINTPKSNVEIKGANGTYDMCVGGAFIVNALQDDEENGLYLNNVRMVKSTTGLVPVDIEVASNTRITVGPSVVLGFISAGVGTTNIEVINNGMITQLNFMEMELQQTYTKPQIYVYNLGEIFGVLGSYSIILPAESIPYDENNPLAGNTKIIKGITSGDITVGGSDNFTNSDINDSETEISVLPIENNPFGYIVYIKEPTESLQGLLEEYFTEQEQLEVSDISTIKKLIVWTLNAQSFEAEDFVYANSSYLPSLEYLSLYNCKVTDGVTLNKIPDNAFENNDTLETILLPRAVVEIGDNAFAGVNLGNIPQYLTDEFNFVTLPNTVTTIGTNAFNNSKYIKFESAIPPTIGDEAFSTSFARVFVPAGSIDSYQSVEQLASEHIYISGKISDDHNYFVFDTTGGSGISYAVNNTWQGSTMGIPETLQVERVTRTIVEIGDNSYRGAVISASSGVAVSLPTTVVRIGPYAFYQDRINSIVLQNVTSIGKYAFYETALSTLTGNAVSIIGEYAFYNTTLGSINFPNLYEIKSNAFANSSLMYNASVGTVSIIGDRAFYNCPQMQTFFINNSDSLLVNNTEQINLTVGTEAFFSNWGSVIDGRLRFYVPDVTLASGKTALQLYKNKFSSNSNFIYVSGIQLGSYQYFGVPNPLSMYTVREISMPDHNNASVSGYEIISYQGPDIDGDIPAIIEINSEEYTIISIGEGAYQNAEVEAGAVVNMESIYLLNIGKIAFKGLNLGHAVLPEVVSIGESAFEGSTLKYGFFDYLNTLGPKAFYNCDQLYRLKLGPVTTIGSFAAAGTSNLTGVFISNESRDISYAGNAFTDAGININNRFRMYVPDSDNLVDFYKVLFPSFADYIYPTGTIFGSFFYNNYDIGAYSLRSITKNNADGVPIQGYELIEYHGEDLNEDFVFPETITSSDNSLNITYNMINAGTNAVTINAVLHNIGDQTLTSWEFDISKIGNMTATGSTGVSVINTDPNVITFKNTNNTHGRILAGATKQITITISSTDVINDITILETRCNTNAQQTEYSIISVGDLAFSHVTVETGAIFNISSDTLLHVGKSAFANMNGIRHVTLNNVVTLENSSFESSSLTQGSFTSLNLMGNSVFKNTINLYILNLGKVQTMGSESITNAPHLYQLFFEPPSNIGLTIDSNVFNNLGGSTSDRFRIYVTNGITAGEENVEVYKAHFPDAYSSYFYSFDNLVGSFIPIGLVDTIDIGEFSVKNKTIDGSTGYEIVEYHGGIIDATYEFPTLLSLNDRYLEASVTTPILNGTGPYSGNTILRITNNGTENISSWKVIIDYSNSGSVVSATANGNAGITREGTKLVIVNASYNGTINAGSYREVTLNISLANNNSTSRILSVNQNNSSNSHIPVISIGDFAFGHAVVDSSASYTIESEYLLNIGESAFENNPGIRSIKAQNCKKIANNSFRNASNLVLAEFPSLTTLGNYAFYNNTNLVVVDIGQVNELGEFALANDRKIARLTMRSTNYLSATSNMGITINTGALDGMGADSSGRLRIYVPRNGAINYVNAYKQTLPSSYTQYIYEAGEIIGSSIFNGYDIGEYCVLSKTRAGVTGLEIIDYHGGNIDGDFSIPATAEINGSSVDITSIGDRAFILATVASGYDWFLDIPSTVVYIGEYAFYQREMTNISGGIITEIGQYAFAESPNLIGATFESVVVVGYSAFRECTELTTVILGTGTTEIKDYAFYVADFTTNSLGSIYIDNMTPPTIYDNSLPPTRVWFWGLTATIYVPVGATGNYTGGRWNYYTIRESGNIYNSKWRYDIINNNQIKITKCISPVNSEVIPATFTIRNVTYQVVQIAAEAFDDVSGVTSLEIGANVKNVGNGFLSGNSTIRTITVNQNNTNFKDYNGVLYSYDLETLITYPRAKTGSSFTIPDTTKVIASKSFLNVNAISTLTIPSSIVAISDSAFTNMRALRTINFEGFVAPYLMGFDFLPSTVTTLNISNNTDTWDDYENDLFFSWYSSMLE